MKLEQINKTELKKLSSLKQKKYRNDLGLFLVEGFKVVNEFLAADWEVYALLIRQDKSTLASEFDLENPFLLTNAEMSKISDMKTPPEMIGVFHVKSDSFKILNDKCLALYNINDPGNLGTIIRTADWFGIKNIICSSETVDCYNPKVVRSSMGSLARLNIHYTNNFINTLHQTNLPIYLADMHGKSILEHQLEENAILVMGSESHGVSDLSELKSTIISIPRIGKAESLNVAIACSIICSHWMR